MLKQLQLSERSFVHFCSSQLLLVCKMFRNIIFSWYWRMLAHDASMLFPLSLLFRDDAFLLSVLLFRDDAFPVSVLLLRDDAFPLSVLSVDEVRELVTILCSSLCSFSSHEPRWPTINIVMNHIRKMYSN